jgi:hypothetical protein
MTTKEATVRTPPPQMASKTPRYITKARKAGEGNYASSVPKLRALREKMLAAEPLPKITVKLDDPLPCECSVGVTLLELAPNMCRWPLGPTMAKAEFFCGAPGYPYCRDHARLAFDGKRRDPISIPASLAGDRRKRAA